MALALASGTALAAEALPVNASRATTTRLKTTIADNVSFTRDMPYSLLFKKAANRLCD